MLRRFPVNFPLFYVRIPPKDTDNSRTGFRKGLYDKEFPRNV